MKTTESYPSQVLAALTKIEPNLPGLVGEEGWQQIGTRVNQTLTTLHNTAAADQQAVLALELIDLLSRYPAADRRLRQVLNTTSEGQVVFAAYLQTQIKTNLLEFASQEGATPVEVEQVLHSYLNLRVSREMRVT